METLQDIWNQILEFTARFILPDWPTVIAFLPVAMLAVAVLVFGLLGWRYAHLGPRRVRPARVQPIPPSGVHLGPISFAPVLAGIGVALSAFGLVAGGWVLVTGLVALILSLLYWLREGLRDYEHLPDVAARRQLPAVAHDGPPPGVHMIGPSFLPLVGALGTAALLFGLVFGGALLLVGVIILILSLVPWLRDAVREYPKTVAADRTGHIESLPAPKWPKLILSVIAILFVGGMAINAGLIPPGSASGGGGAPGSPSPSGSGGPPPSGEPSGPPPSGEPSGPAPPAGDVTIVALNTQFTTPEVAAPGETGFTIAFDNQDNGQPHDVDILSGDGAKLFDGDIVTGPAVRIYDVPALPVGRYSFVCSVHSNMTGTITTGE